MISRRPNETLFEFVLRFFDSSHERSGSQQAEATISVNAHGGGPQEVCRLLDESQDIAEVYSHEMPPRKGSADRQCSKAPVVDRNSRDFPKAEQRVSGREVSKGKVEHRATTGNTALPAQVSGREISGAKRTPLACERAQTPAPNSLTFLDLRCATVADSNKWGELECEAPAKGICKHCGLPICRNCEKWEACTSAPKHEVTIQ